MKVQLAVEFEGHKPDATIEVEDWRARQLIYQGRARAVAGKETKADKESAQVAEAVQAASEEAAAAAVTVVTESK